MGLYDVNFSEITISNPVYTYEYTVEGLVQNNVMYPLKFNGNLVAWAIPLSDNSNSNYQITTALVNDVNLLLQDGTDFALIYDYDYCYLYNGSELFLLTETTYKVENRLMLNTDSVCVNDFNIQLTNIADSTSLNYYSQPTTRAQTYYSCPVNFVSQNPPSLLCWAASIACVVNYKKGTTYTAVQVAQKHYGNTDFNKGLPLGDEDNILISDYFLLYRYKNEVPGDGVIGKNIINDYPILATFKWSDGYHLVVIYGINTISGYISIMDPEFGACSATISGSSYKYVSAYSGTTLTLNRATCKYWSV